MDEEMKQRLVVLEQKMDAIYRTTERMRQYFLWTLVITIALVVLPAIGLIFAVPSLIDTYSSLNSIGSF